MVPNALATEIASEMALETQSFGIEILKDIQGTEGDDTLSGGASGDTIDGLGGDDLIHGGGGDDSLVGGDGNDRLYGGPGNDTLVGGAGIDMLHAGHGNDLLEGGDDNDVLYAGHGNATLDGGAGVDGALFAEVSGNNLVVDLSSGIATTSTAAFELISIESVIANAHSATLTGSDADNTLVGSNHSDILNGGGGDDVLNAGAGKDTLTGGHGADVLMGGTGADTFVFTDVNDSTPLSSDNIQGLEKHDTIDLSAIDADSTVGGNQSFTIVDQFTGHAGELMMYFDSGSGNTFIDGDTNGDGIADLRITVAGDLSFNFHHFVL